ncbi:MAG TPA: GNAT family protein [Phototrophicaceae bacterium]|nr:GNAT family protein [Phototrophicaceae bacterium]
MFNPLFQGRLLRLAAPLPEDAAVFAAWSQDDTYGRLLDDDPIRPQSAADFASFAAPNSDANSFYFHLRTLDDDRLIGFVVLFNIKWSNQSAQLAIGIGPENYRGKGYGQDALRLLLNYAFAELNLHRVGLTVLDYNTRAINAYERAGFIREGVQRQAVQRAGRFFDLILYSLLREEWAAVQR